MNKMQKIDKELLSLIK